MATDITNGKGAILAVNTTAQKIEIVPGPGNAGHQKSALTLEVINDSAVDVFFVVNCEASDYVEASALVVKSGKSVLLIDQPIRKFVIAAIAGTSGNVEVVYNAY